MNGLKPSFRLNPNAVAAWRKGIRDLAAVIGKSDPAGLQNLVLMSARRFVKNVADITPPSTGKADSTAKKRGEQAILGDLLKLAIPAQAIGASARHAKEILISSAELLEAYRNSRSASTGRVNPRNRKEKLLISPAEFNRALKQVQNHVGWLAAALNAASARLNFRLPSWIARHGAAHGSITVHATAHGIKIRIIQDTPFADHVHGYSAKWHFALNKEINAIANQAKAIVHRRAKRAGFKLH